MFAKHYFRKSIVMSVAFLFLLVSASIAADKSYTMTGKISVIDLMYDTVVIEVPLGTQMFTVAGPLAADARLTKGSQPATLQDFSVGERVTVRFHSTDQGHVIDRLHSS